MDKNNNDNLPNKDGYYGAYGGRYVPDTLYAPLREIEIAFRKYRNNFVQHTLYEVIRMAVGIINADEVKVYGAITGQIFAKSVFLAKTARLIGDVTHESIAIEPGAYMEGHCRRVNDPIHAEGNKNPDLMLTDERKDKLKSYNFV